MARLQCGHACHSGWSRGCKYGPEAVCVPQLPLCCHLMEFNSNYSGKKRHIFWGEKGHTFNVCKMVLGTQTGLQTLPGPCPPPVTPTFTPNPTPPIHTGIPNLSSPSRDLFSSPPSGQSGAQCERKRGWGGRGHPH